MYYFVYETTNLINDKNTIDRLLDYLREQDVKIERLQKQVQTLEHAPRYTQTEHPKYGR